MVYHIMNRFINIILLVVFCFIFNSCTKAQTQYERKYKLVWSDEFDDKSIDTSSWSFMKRIPYSCGQYWSSNSSLYKVGKGRIRLYAKRNNMIEQHDTAHYLTAAISTEHKRTIKYGKIEVRAKVKGAIGSWPAIWTLREDGQNDVKSPRYAEIDLMEYLDRNDFAYQTVHTAFTLKNKKFKNQVQSKIVYEKYNVYTVEILPDAVICGVNGKDTFIYTKDSTELNESQFPFGIACYLMIDMQVGTTSTNSWIKKVDPKSYPAYMDIDYVRFYDFVQ